MIDYGVDIKEISQNEKMISHLSMTKEIQTAHNEEQTAEIAQNIAKTARSGDVFCLHGTLGAGKTSFCRSFIRALVGSDVTVPSPTFTLVQTYDTQEQSIWHFDLYRLEYPDEIYEIGWEEALSDNICLIEWPDKAGTFIPDYAIHIHIDIMPKDVRQFTILRPPHEQ